MDQIAELSERVGTGIERHWGGERLIGQWQSAMFRIKASRFFMAMRHQFVVTDASRSASDQTKNRMTVANDCSSGGCDIELASARRTQTGAD
jgi:hypothetical protein